MEVRRRRCHRYYTKMMDTIQSSSNLLFFPTMWILLPLSFASMCAFRVHLWSDWATSSSKLSLTVNILNRIIAIVLFWTISFQSFRRCTYGQCCCCWRYVCRCFWQCLLKWHSNGGMLASHITIHHHPTTDDGNNGNDKIVIAQVGRNSTELCEHFSFACLVFRLYGSYDLLQPALEGPSGYVTAMKFLWNRKFAIARKC